MGKLSDTGRIFFGIAIVVLGFQTIYYHDFPYMLIPPKHSWIPGFAMLVYFSGGFIFVAGASIILGIKTRLFSLLFGIALLLIFCLYFVPHIVMHSPDNGSFSKWIPLGDAWENAEKELALSGGAFIVASCYQGKEENPVTRFLAKLIPIGKFFFPVTIICFGIDHFLYAADVAGYIPDWVPFHIFWAYFAGFALIGSGVGIIVKIKPALSAVLLGIMIFTWFAILHIPRVLVSPAAEMKGEVTSAFLALAYSGIAFVIAGNTTTKSANK
jgi:uncharacterized membrane protein YphA (DoxX/SURF4 family)